MSSILPTNAVKAVIFNHEGAILLLQRNPAIRNGESNWDLPGGLVEVGEDPVVALRREVSEELSIQIKVLEPSGTWHFDRAKDNQRVSVQNYLCTITDGDIHLSDEHIQYQWVQRAALTSYPVKDSSLYDALADVPVNLPDAAWILDDLLLVGPTKPLGYLPISTLRDYRVDLGQLEETLMGRGLTTIRLTQLESGVNGGALYAYHDPSLRALLQGCTAVLAEAGWSQDPEDFIRHLHPSTPSHTPLFDLIADAFADWDNAGRTKARPPHLSQSDQID